MATMQTTAVFPCPVETLWRTVTDLEHTAWRSDLDRVEVLGQGRFVEYTANGAAVFFSVTACRPCRLWAFTLENDHLTGSWEGRFERTANGARLRCAETIRAKHGWMRPLVPLYLRRQQKRYVRDLRRALAENETSAPG